MQDKMISVLLHSMSGTQANTLMDQSNADHKTPRQSARKCGKSDGKGVCPETLCYRTGYGKRMSNAKLLFNYGCGKPSIAASRVLCKAYYVCVKAEEGVTQSALWLSQYSLVSTYLRIIDLCVQILRSTYVGLFFLNSEETEWHLSCFRATVST